MTGNSRAEDWQCLQEATSGRAQASVSCFHEQQCSPCGKARPHFSGAALLLRGSACLPHPSLGPQLMALLALLYGGSSRQPCQPTAQSRGSSSARLPPGPVLGTVTSLKPSGQECRKCHELSSLPAVTVLPSPGSQRPLLTQTVLCNTAESHGPGPGSSSSPGRVAL